MENDFKVPTFEPKSKLVTQKSKPSADNLNESKEISPSELPPSETAVKEPESAKSESNLEQKFTPKCPYQEPKWSAAPDSSLNYSFEILKGGQIVDNVNNLQSKAYWTIGKFQNNDIAMAHPTISRYHAVLQYRPDVVVSNDENSDDDENSTVSNAAEQKPKVDKGWYLYDLNSTHGSFVNKMKVPPKTYVRIRVGYMLKFGASTRNYILQGPGFDEDAESELTITEMKELRLKKQQEQQEKLLEEERKREEEGISWGMAEDAEEETDLSHNPFAATTNEELFLQDPKKTLRGYFEREGLNLDYNVDEISNGTYLCRIELPITDSVGRSVMAEFTHKGKKKECVAQCALEACRILDRNGLLRQANHEPRKRKVQSSDDDDDDEFYDRTAGAEEKRRRKTTNEDSVAFSYEQLLTEEQKLQSQLIETEQRIERYQQLGKASKEKEAMDVDDLDDFMSGLSSEKQMDKADVRKCRFELQRIKSDIQRVQKLISIAKPIELPPLKTDRIAADAAQTKKSLPLFGKKKTFGFDKLKSQVAIKQPASSSQSKANTSDSIEEFDDDEDTKDVTIKNPKITIDSSTENAPKAASTKPINDDTSDNSKSCDGPIQDHAKETKTKESASTENKEEEEEEEEEAICKHKQALSNSEQHDSISSSSTVNISNVQSSSSSSNSAAANNKPKSRNRQRNKMRHQIDIDDTEEDTSPHKYASWMPPENQTGDGMTQLNSKYGY